MNLRYFEFFNNNSKHSNSMVKGVNIFYLPKNIWYGHILKYTYVSGVKRLYKIYSINEHTYIIFLNDITGFKIR